MVCCINRHLDSFKNAYSLHPSARWKSPRKLLIMSKEQPLFKTKRWSGYMVIFQTFLLQELHKHLLTHLSKWLLAASGPGLRERVHELVLPELRLLNVLTLVWAPEPPGSLSRPHPTQAGAECSKSSPGDYDVQSGLKTSMMDKESEAQRGQVTCSRSHSKPGKNPGIWILGFTFFF